MAGYKRFINVHTYKNKSAQSCLTLWDPMDCSPLGFTIHGILQARILMWVLVVFSH